MVAGIVLGAAALAAGALGEPWAAAVFLLLALCAFAAALWPPRAGAAPLEPARWPDNGNGGPLWDLRASQPTAQDVEARLGQLRADDAQQVLRAAERQLAGWMQHAYRKVDAHQLDRWRVQALDDALRAHDARQALRAGGAQLDDALRRYNGVRPLF
jgi:hypothetical protein